MPGLRRGRKAKDKVKQERQAKSQQKKAARNNRRNTKNDKAV